VDMVFGPQTLHRLPQMYDEVRARRRPVVDVSFPEIEKFDHLPQPQANGVTAFVSIMEGCNKYCSFCVVPYTRGEEISRPFDDVLAEIVALAAQGVREINLLGQNVNAYRGPTHDGGIADLASLIEYVAAIDGIERIRYTTSHPLEFSASLIAAYARIPQLVNHLHLPVQSGSDRILAQMKRGHTILEYKAKLRQLVSPVKQKRILRRPWISLPNWVLIIRSALSIAGDLAHRPPACPMRSPMRLRNNACNYCRHVLRNRPPLSVSLCLAISKAYWWKGRPVKTPSKYAAVLKTIAW